ncbi:hypothetical protein HBB16_14730 [Pseudonocardia sp. MCCB 268]|nr:hypothetical protein [Pseudonocardia cytotoxica]
MIGYDRHPPGSSNSWMTVRHRIRRPTAPRIYGVVDSFIYALVVPRDDAVGCTSLEQFCYPVGERRWEFPAGTAPDRRPDRPSWRSASSSRRPWSASATDGQRRHPAAPGTNRNSAIRTITATVRPPLPQQQ